GASDFLRMIAENTGAEAIVNTNTPERAMRHAITDASAFYLIGYAPVKNESDGKFHQIKVRVKPRGLDVRARRGYWAPRVADVERAKREAAIEAPVEMTAALGTLSASRPERTVDVWAGISRGADGGIRAAAIRQSRIQQERSPVHPSGGLWIRGGGGHRQREFARS